MAIAIGSSIGNNFYNQEAYNKQRKAVDKEAAGTPLENDPDHQKKPGRKSSPAECETCKNRKYQDGSDENVSFKTAQHVSPSASGAAVRSHEAEHVKNAYSKAAKENGQVISAGVSIQTAVCPECGSVYTAGGETRTVVKYSDESNPYQQNQKSLDAVKYVGANVDYAA